MPTRNTYVVIIVFVGLALLLGGLGSAYQNAGYVQTATDEPLTVDYNDPSELPPDRATNFSATVNITVDGSELEAGSDYEYNASTGVVTWLNSTSTTDGDTALATYRYTAVSDATQNRQSILGAVSGLAPYFALALGIGATWALVEGGDW